MISKERWEQSQRYIAALEEVGIQINVDKKNRCVSTIIERWKFYDPLPFTDFHVSIYSKVLSAYKSMGYKIDASSKIS